MPTKDANPNDIVFYFNGEPIYITSVTLAMDSIPTFAREYDSVWGAIPNKRVSHLLHNAKSHRVREKNWKRILKIAKASEDKSCR